MPKNSKETESRREIENGEKHVETNEQGEVSEQDFWKEYRELTMLLMRLSEAKEDAINLRRRLLTGYTIEYFHSEKHEELQSEAKRLEKLIEEMTSLMDKYFEEIVSLLSQDQYTQRRMELKKIGPKRGISNAMWQLMGRELRAIQAQENRYALVKQKFLETEKRMRGQKFEGTEDTPEYEQVVELIENYNLELESILSGGGLTNEERREYLVKKGKQLEEEAGKIIKKASLFKGKVKLELELAATFVKDLASFFFSGEIFRR